MIFIFTSIVHSQVEIESPPSYEAYIAVDNTIDSPPSVDAPKMDLELKGMEDPRPELRSSISVADEVGAKQGQLSELFKSFRLKGSNVERFFGLLITVK